ncbi:MAG TPA: FAD-binding protein [Thermoleophilia bacterium]|nr:FAD-binding protein [Thermoleophilia bacterium]
MATLESLGTVLQADVLIVGGGMAGLACAIAAKGTDPDIDVLIVDKVVTGWGGKANKGGGNIVFMDPADGFENVLDFHVHNVGDFLEDQELLMDFVRESRSNLEKLESWGVHIYRDDAGEPKYVRWLPEHPWRMAVLDQDLTLNMARHARKLGVRIEDRVEIVDLLKDGDQVCGAIGFGMIDGECVIAQARAVVLANGNQCYKLMPRWASAGGEGIAAAYRAGAAMRGAEFGNFINWVFADTKEVCQGAEDVLYNNKGENISKRVRPTLESDVHSKEVVEWWREMKAGNGPICANMAENYVNNEIVPAFHADALAVRPVSMKFWGLTIGKAMAASTVHSPMQPVMPGLNAELAPVKVDHQMATTVPGLFAIGDTCYAGTCLAGAVPAPPGRMRGSGLGFATFSGARCAPAAVAAARAASGRPDAAQAEALKARVFAPLGRNGMAAPEMVRAVQDVMAPVGYSIYKHADRMNEALDTVLALKAQVPSLTAADPHYLAACHVAESMVLGAEMFYRASLAREESRGWHLREDFPEPDDANFLKWIELRDDGGEMAVSLRDVPLDRYPIQP